MAKGEIHYPKLGTDQPIRSSTFVAFGRSDRGILIQGWIYDENDNPYQGELVYWCRSRISIQRMFWILQFTNVPAGQGHTYTLKIFDANNDDPNEPLYTVPNLTIANAAGGLPRVTSFSVAYPNQLDNPIPNEFAASGSGGQGGGTVSGTVSEPGSPPTSLPSTCMQEFPPPSWGLSMSVSDFTEDTNYTLTVTEGALQGSSADLQFEEVKDP